jgi:cytidylate kinase
MAKKIKQEGPAPVITIDGPGGSGKGTLSSMLAHRLGWHFLDSGVLYRVLAYAAMQESIDLAEKKMLAELAKRLETSFIVTEDQEVKIALSGKDVTQQIRTEQCGNAASKVGAHPEVRAALLEAQRHFRRLPGLVTDGRDMGSVVFPDAILKFFLDASADVRAKRRHKQLQEKGIDVSLEMVLQEILQRDQRDRERPVAPLKPPENAIIIDTTYLNVQQTFERLWKEVSSLPDLSA